MDIIPLLHGSIYTHKRECTSISIIERIVDSYLPREDTSLDYIGAPAGLKFPGARRAAEPGTAEAVEMKSE
jgi:hypothetical protein